MTDFFTPIQVITQNSHNDHEYEIEKYNTDPFMPVLIKEESLGDHRKKIIQWLKNMPIASRINKLTFTNKQFSCLLMGMYERIQQRDKSYLLQFGITLVPEKGFKISQQKFNRNPNPKLVEAQHKLISSTYIANRYSRFDSVSVSPALASDVNSLFQLFDVIENGISYQLTQSNYHNYCNETKSQQIFYNPMDYDCTMTKSLGSWIVEILKKNLCIQYFKQSFYKTQTEFQQTSRNPNDLKVGQTRRQFKSDVSQLLKIKAKLFKKYWGQFNQQSRQKFIQNILKRDIRVLLNEFRQTIRITHDTFPQIKCCYPQQIAEFVQYLKSVDGELFFNQLTFTNLEKASIQIGIYKYQIMIQFELEIERLRKQQTLLIKKKFSKIIKNKKQRRNSIQFQKNISKVEREKVIKQQQKTHMTDHQMKAHEISQQSHSIKQLQTKIKKKATHLGNGHANIISNSNTTSCKTNKKKKKKQQNIIQLKKLQNSSASGKQRSQTTNDQDQKELQLEDEYNKFKLKQTYQKYHSLEVELQGGKGESFNANIQTNTKKSLAETQFNHILKQFQQKTKKWTKYQQIAINRIASLLYNYNLSYQIFGSYANGLNIASSDIDICIDPTIIHYFYTTFCSYKQKVVLALQFLWSCFEQMNCCSNFKLITTASVPVLVFQIDLGVGFGDVNNMHYNIKKQKVSPKVCVDLTIQPFVNMHKQFVPHLGFQSTALVKQWLREFKHLGQLVRVVKHLLNSKNLNKSFTGGISSYALTSIIYSFLKSDVYRRQQSIMSLLIQFCQFIQNFDEKQTKIQVFNVEPIQKCKVDKLTVENYLNGKNLTDNCYRFSEIKNLLGKVKETLSSYGQFCVQKDYAKKLRSIILQ